jgi:hypothetical protein
MRYISDKLLDLKTQEIRKNHSFVEVHDGDSLADAFLSVTIAFLSN